jgi:hypothetical protein
VAYDLAEPIEEHRSGRDGKLRHHVCRDESEGAIHKRKFFRAGSARCW